MGHIDLLTTMSYFEVPEADAERVIRYVNGQRYKGREVRCNDAAEGGKRPSKSAISTRSGRPAKSEKPSRAAKPAGTAKPKEPQRTYKKEDWMQFLNPKDKKLKGEIPDFSEEGWAIRKPRNKK